MYFGYGYYFDWYYIPILLAVLFSVWTSIQVRSTFRRYSQVYNRRGVTGADAARAVLAANGVGGVRIERISGELTDHYDPRSNVIRLSADVYDSATPAAVGVAAHEAGHAVQCAVGYGPIKLRAAIVPAVNFGSKLSMPLLLIGLLLDATLYACCDSTDALLPVPTLLTQDADRSQAETVLTALLNMPEKNGIRSCIPAGTKLLSTRMEGSSCVVDLTAEFVDDCPDAASQTRAVRAVVATLCKLRGVSGVEILVEGLAPVYRDPTLTSVRVPQAGWIAD